MMVSAVGLTGMMRQPSAFISAGTSFDGLAGLALAPTTVIVS